LERSNLLVRFSDLHGSDMHCPDVDEPLDLQTKAASPEPAKTNSNAQHN
jgi:hypothetical protein